MIITFFGTIICFSNFNQIQFYFLSNNKSTWNLMQLIEIFTCPKNLQTFCKRPTGLLRLLKEPTTSEVLEKLFCWRPQMLLPEIKFIIGSFCRRYLFISNEIILKYFSLTTFFPNSTQCTRFSLIEIILILEPMGAWTPQIGCGCQGLTWSLQGVPFR